MARMNAPTEWTAFRINTSLVIGFLSAGRPRNIHTAAASLTFQMVNRYISRNFFISPKLFHLLINVIQIRSLFCARAKMWIKESIYFYEPLAENNNQSKVERENIIKELVSKPSLRSSDITKDLASCARAKVVVEESIRNAVSLSPLSK